MKGLGCVRALLVILLLLPSAAAGDAPDSEREIIELVPDQKAGAGSHSFLAPFWSLLRGGTGHWYGQRTLEVDTTPQGATLDVFYVRANFQKRFEQGESPATIVLPSRVEAGPRDTVTIRALLDGYREREVRIRVRSRQSAVRIDLAPLPNALVAVSHVYLAERAALAFLTTEALAFRLQKSNDGIAVILTQTANTPEADETIQGVSDALIAALKAQQLGEDLMVNVGLTDAARGEVEVRSLQGFDPIRGLHSFTLNLVPADQGASGVRRARAALSRIGPRHVHGCALVFDESLRSQLEPADLARALAPKGAFTDPFLRAAMKRLGEVSPDGVVSLTDGSSYRVAAPIELAAAGNQAAEVRGYLALLRRFVAELGPELHRQEALRGLVAPEVGSARFAQVLDRAEARERRCLADGD
ncbi:MAG: hypothetical protein OEM05_09510 [Myxococcales bacterium]|nr:hypothetical protein [Myxococcales bacterium]